MRDVVEHTVVEELEELKATFETSVQAATAARGTGGTERSSETGGAAESNKIQEQQIQRQTLLDHDQLMLRPS